MTVEQAMTYLAGIGVLGALYVGCTYWITKWLWKSFGRG